MSAPKPRLPPRWHPTRFPALAVSAWSAPVIVIAARLQPRVEPLDEADNVIHRRAEGLFDLRRVGRQIGALADDGADVGVLAQQLLRHAEYFALLRGVVDDRLAGAVVVAEDAV